MSPNNHPLLGKLPLKGRARRSAPYVAVMMLCAGLLLCLPQAARADAIASSSISFSGFTISSSGTLVFSGGWAAQAFAQARNNLGGLDTQSSSDAGAVAASASVLYANASGNADAGLLNGDASSNADIPGTVSASASSTGTGTLANSFMLTGGTGSVDVTFSVMISGSLDVTTGPDGVLARTETIFNQQLNGAPILFYDNLLSVGPNSSASLAFSQTLTQTVALNFDTPYAVVVQADSESQATNVTPEPGTAVLWFTSLVGLASLVAAAKRREVRFSTPVPAAREQDKSPATRTSGFRLAFFAALFAATMIFPAELEAKYIGAEPPACLQCECNCPSAMAGRAPGPSGSYASNTEGNASVQYSVPGARSAFGSTLGLTFTYNSYNADGSRAQLDTMVGYGWTHTYNIYLFNQVGNMFRMDAQGRVTKYQFQSGGTFTTATGYFETLINHFDGTFTIHQKDGTNYLFGMIANTPFSVFGTVYRLLTITDRNGNVTSVSYDGSGNLAQVTDTYGRALTYSYDSHRHLSSVTDPLGRVTQFTYDTSGTHLTQITDALGRVTQYTYDTSAHITKQVDRDGRVFTYTYSALEPSGINDGTGAHYFHLTNPGNWATDPTSLAEYQLRVYNPAITSKTDGRGHVWQYTYDTNGYVTQIVAPDGATTKYAYDPGTLETASMTDPNGNTTLYQYDSEGNMTQLTDAVGHVTKYTYEPAFNQVASMTDPQGRLTTYTYDSHGNRVSETDPLLQTETWTYDSHGNVTSHTDKNGHTTAYTYDAEGNLSATTDPLSNVTTTVYDAQGNLTSRTDADSHITRWNYDDLDRLITETDPLGHTTTTAYDGQNHVTSIADRDGNTTLYQYDARGRLVKTTDPLGHSTTTTYDGDNNSQSVTDKDGHATKFIYDVQDRRIQTTDALGNTMKYQYDPAGNAITMTDPNGHATHTTYDGLNRKATSTDAVGSVTTTQYDSTGPNTGPCAGVCTGPTEGSSLPTEVIDGDGKVTYFKYDGLDRRVQEVRKQGPTADVEPPNPNDAVTYTTYDAVGNRLSVTEPDGNTTTDVYDADNRLTKETSGAGDMTTTIYDGVGNVMSTTAPTTNVTNTTYDPDNRVASISDGGGPLMAYTYDPVGNRLTTTDGDGNTTTTTYDADYRIIQVTDPLGQSTHYTYDPVGNEITMTDRNGNATTYAYDAINRRTGITDALGNVTQYQYDKVGNLTKLTDANLHATSYSYDGVNRLTKETYADTFSRTYTYDFVGNLTSRKDQDGRTTTYTYSDLYFLDSRAYPSSTDTFTYDLSGRMLSNTRAVTSPPSSWAESFTYDGADRIVTSTQNGQTVSYSYDIPGRHRVVNYPGGRSTTENRDLRSRLSTIDDAGSPPPIVQYTYDAANNVISRAYRNGTSTAFTYNANYWILNLQHSFGVTPIAGFNYAYDNEGNKQFEQKLQDHAHSEAYQYDIIYRLIDYKVGVLVGSTVPVPTTQTAYTLDPVGNWTLKVKDAIPENRTHNAVNEITTINALPLTYDHNGNLTKDTAFTYSYDEENRLTAVKRNSDSAVVGQYQYDALSRRVQKIADPAGPPVTTRYFYDGARIIEEQDGGGVTQATYVYGNYVDEVLTMDRGGQTYYYHQNALWSVEAVTDSTGIPVERYSYDAYGAPSVTDGSFTPIPPNAWGTPHSAIGNPWLFTGRQLDEETGLYFYRARYYDDAKGRFLQRDPLEYVDGTNLYEYVFDNPIKFADPFGLKKCCGVESFKVTWTARDQGNGRFAAFRLDYDVKFKSGTINGVEYDPKCCEFKQNVKSKYRVKYASGAADLVVDTSPMHDDHYSRDDNEGGNKDRSLTTFKSNDNPGWSSLPGSPTLVPGDDLDYEFTAEQIVYAPGSDDCTKNDEVAKKGPHTGTIKGKYEARALPPGVQGPPVPPTRIFTGVPAEL